MDFVRLLSSFVLAALSLVLTVCATPGSLGVPDRPPTLRGRLVEVRHSATASGFLIEPGGGACSLQATGESQTRYFRRTADRQLVPLGTGAAGAGALASGMTASVWVDGPVMESCPMQGRAGVVVVEPGEAVAAADLPGRWVHAAEEDLGGVEVYRRGQAEDFPPRMYRQRYILHRNGRAEALVPHPADAHYLAGGSWTLNGDVLTIRYEGRTDRLRVVSVTGDVLRVVRER